jgi:hypothetical protein
MKVYKRTITAMMCCILVVLAPIASGADRDRRHAVRPEHRSPRWHGDIHRFRQHDLPRWRQGHWFHGVHRGRYGWWWIVPGLEIWYLYSVPVYPYPDPYIPPHIYTPTPPPPPQYWYYCRSANSYYPYVSSCPEGWQKIPAGPSR